MIVLKGVINDKAMGLGNKKHSGEWFRSTDLWVMSPARYHCATPLVTGRQPPQNPYHLQTNPHTQLLKSLHYTSIIHHQLYAPFRQKNESLKSQSMN